MSRKNKNAPASTGEKQRAKSPTIQRRQYAVLPEWRRVVRDVRVGALPLRALPGFLLWLIRGESTA
jgi:hypothetical protein